MVGGGFLFQLELIRICSIFFLMSVALVTAQMKANFLYIESKDPRNWSLFIPLTAIKQKCNSVFVVLSVYSTNFLSNNYNFPGLAWIKVTMNRTCGKGHGCAPGKH